MVRTCRSGRALSRRRLRGRFVEAAELRALYESDPDVKHSIDVAWIRRQATSRRHHAAAVVITKERCSTTCRSSESRAVGIGEDAPIVTQYEATAIEKLGC